MKEKENKNRQGYPKYSKKIPLCHSIHHKSNKIGPVIEPETPPWEAGD
jgi:hypothetical protein